MLLDSFSLPLVNSSALDAPIGDATRDSGDAGVAESEAAHPFPHRLSHQDGCVSQDASAFCGSPNAQSRELVSCFGARSRSVSAYRNRESQADGAGISCPVAAQAHSTPGDEVRINLQQRPLKYSAEACLASDEEAVQFSHKDQVEPTEQHGHYERCIGLHVKSNDSYVPLSRVVCNGSAHGATQFHDPSGQANMESLNACEESTSSQQDGEGSSARAQGTFEDSTCSQIGCNDACEDSEAFTQLQETTGDSANGNDSAQDPLEEIPDPHFELADADNTSSQQPCLSDCSSAISMITDATSEVTSRLDYPDMRSSGEDSHWTDAKHGSYLDYMETRFVNNLYGRHYCALDVCGQQPSHQKVQSSSPWPSALFESKSWQRRSMRKLPLFTCIPLALRPSPWVNHFRHRKVPLARRRDEFEHASTFCGIDGEEEVNSHSLEVCKGFLGHHHASGSSLECAETSVAVGLSKQNGLQVFAYEPDIASCRNVKKQRLEVDMEQMSAIRCRGGKLLRSECDRR